MASRLTSSWTVPLPGCARAPALARAGAEEKGGEVYLGRWGFASLRNKFTPAWLADAEGLGNRLSKIHQVPTLKASFQKTRFVSAIRTGFGDLSTPPRGGQER